MSTEWLPAAPTLSPGCGAIQMLPFFSMNTGVGRMGRKTSPSFDESSVCQEVCKAQAVPGGPWRNTSFGAAWRKLPFQVRRGGCVQGSHSGPNIRTAGIGMVLEVGERRKRNCLLPTFLCANGNMKGDAAATHQQLSWLLTSDTSSQPSFCCWGAVGT